MKNKVLMKAKGAIKKRNVNARAFFKLAVNNNHFFYIQILQKNAPLILFPRHRTVKMPRGQIWTITCYI